MKICQGALLVCNRIFTIAGYNENSDVKSAPPVQAVRHVSYVFYFAIAFTMFSISVRVIGTLVSML